MCGDTHTLVAWRSIIHVMLIKLSCAQLPLILSPFLNNIVNFSEFRFDLSSLTCCKIICRPTQREAPERASLSKWKKKTKTGTERRKIIVISGLSLSVFYFFLFFSIYVSNAPRQEKINESCASVKAKQIVSADSPVKSVLHNIQHSISTEAIESFVYPAFHFCSDN